MPNLDSWINQQNNNNEDTTTTTTTTTISNFENCLLSIRDQYQKIRLNSDHPISNERYEKIIEMIDHTLEKYKEAVNNENNIQQQQQQQNEYEEEEKELLIIINNIFNELDKKRKIAINKNDKDLLRDQIESYRLKETTLDYILYIILEFAGKLI
jgi:hypothetical protein